MPRSRAQLAAIFASLRGSPLQRARALRKKGVLRLAHERTTSGGVMRMLTPNTSTRLGRNARNRAGAQNDWLGGGLGLTPRAVPGQMNTAKNRAKVRRGWKPSSIAWRRK